MKLQTHNAHRARSAESDAPATKRCSRVNQSQFVAKLPLPSMEVQKVPRLPHKSSPRCWKWHACHAKDRGATSVPECRQASADIYGGTESSTPATPIEPEVLKVTRLPRQRPRRHISPRMSPSFRWRLCRCRKYHACHANRARGVESDTPATPMTAAPHQSQNVAKPPLTSMEVQNVPRLPRKSGPRRWKWHACHAKDRGATSVPECRQASADVYGGADSTTPATQIEPEVLKVTRLPRKRPRRHISPRMSPSFRWRLWRYRKYHACHANRARGVESDTPATQKTLAPHQSQNVSKLSFRWRLWRYRKYHACHANRAGGVERNAPATQKNAAPHQSHNVAKLPLTSMKAPNAPRLPRISSLRCWKCHACHVEDSRRPWVHRRRQASADIYEGTESATPATHIAPAVLKVSRLPRRRQSASMGPPSSPSFRGHLWRHRTRHAYRACGAESATPAT